MKTHKQLVILFGAGASHGAFKDRTLPPPVDQDFFEVAGQISGRGTRRLAVRVIKDVFDLYGRVNGIALEQYFRDIETRAEIGRFAKSKNKPKDWEKRQHDLEELIRRVLLHTTCEFDDGPAKACESASHREILGHVRPGDTLITFNYDTVIEEAFPLENLYWNPDDGYGVKASGRTLAWATTWKEKRHVDPKTESQVHLLKLHGSLNWTLYKTNKVRLKPMPYVIRTRGGAPVFDKCAILPPGWHKQIGTNPYRQLWHKARLKLESCSSLAIIGYSMPETDLLARALFAEVSRLRAIREQFLEHLYIADLNENVKNRLVDLFVPALGAKGRVYRYTSMDHLRNAWKNGGPKR